MNWNKNKKVAAAIQSGAVEADTIQKHGRSRKSLRVSITKKIFYMPSYRVSYQVGNSHSTTTLQLEGGMESEAIAKLKSQSTVNKDANVIIKSIQKL